MFELSPDKKTTDEMTRLLIGPLATEMRDSVGRIGRKWPIWTIATPDDQVAVPTNPAACMRKLTELGFIDKMTIGEQTALVKYVRSIKVTLKDRVRKSFWVTPFKKVRYVELDLYELADSLGVTCPDPRNCHWQYLTPPAVWAEGIK